MYDKQLKYPLFKKACFIRTKLIINEYSHLELLLLALKREHLASTSSFVVGASFIAMVAATSAGLDAESLSSALFCKISDSKTGQ